MRKSVVQRIKDFLLDMMVMGLVIIGMGWTGYMESTYSVDGLVIDKDADEWIIEDNRGHIWSYKNNFLIKGDEVKITFFDNHTNNITDETIKISRFNTTIDRDILDVYDLSDKDLIIKYVDSQYFIYIDDLQL